MLRSVLCAGAFLALALPALATDTTGPGFGADAVRPLSLAAAFAAHDTLASGGRVVFDGSLAWIEAEDGTVLSSLGATPSPTFASFVEVDPTETFAILGESSGGVIYRAPLAGGGLVPLCTLPFNYDLAFVGGDRALVSAATCGYGCGNEIYSLDLPSGATALLASVPGPSGPLALSAAGDLHYAVQSTSFPTPPGAVSIVRWSAAQIANGPFPLTLAQASPFTSGLDGGVSMAFDPAFGHLFLSESVYGGTSRVTEIDRAGAVVGAAASALDAVGKLEILDAPGDGALAAFQPAGRRLLYRTTDYNQGTSAITTISPRRPVLTSVQNGNGTMTCTVSGAQPASSCFVISSRAALYNSLETPYDLGAYLFWTGMPLASIRRAGVQFATDPAGSGTFTFANPPSTQGTRVLQVLVRDAHGLFRGASTAAFN